MMTKKDFIALADVIVTHNQLDRPKFTDDHLTTLMEFCRMQNPRFDWHHWLSYIRGECGPNGGAIRKPKKDTQ